MYPHRKDEGCYLFERNPKIRYPLWWYGKDCPEIDCNKCLRLIKYMAGDCKGVFHGVPHTYRGGCKRLSRM